MTENQTSIFAANPQVTGKAACCSFYISLVLFVKQDQHEWYNLAHSIWGVWCLLCNAVTLQLFTKFLVIVVTSLFRPAPNAEATCALQAVVMFLMSHMLCRPQVESFPEPQRNLRLDIQLSIPKWGKACGWSARDDAMLMLGVHWHGLAHWENIAADER